MGRNSLALTRRTTCLRQDGRNDEPVTTPRIALLAALILACRGCLVGSGGRGESSLPNSSAFEAATLTVENNNWLDVAVYVVEGGGKISILRASTNRTVTADIPAKLVKNGITLMLLADFVGATDNYRSESIFLRPGQELYWRLEDDLRYSSLWIYRVR